MGSDSALWGLSARDLGIQTLVPPLYPGLVAGLHGLGIPLVAAGWLISSLAHAALSSTVFVLARALGAATVPAAVAAGVALIHPALFEFAHQLQPDALSALFITLLALLSLRSERCLWAAALGGVLLFTREHGAALLVPLAILVWRRGSTSRERFLPIALLLIAGWIGLEAPWADRAGGALEALQATDPAELPFLRELNQEDRMAYAQLIHDGDRVGQLSWHASRSLNLAWSIWGLLILSLVLAIASARRGDTEPLWTALLLTGALPALVIWSQARHIALLAPIALALCAACWPASKGARALAGLAMLGLLIPWPAQYQKSWEGQRGETLRAQNLAELGEWICTRSPEGAFLGGFIQDVGLYCPLRRHDPDGSMADWRTWLVTDREPPPSELGEWTAVYGESGPLQIYQLDPEREPRPCADAVIDPSSPHLAIARATGKLDCEASP
jgi:hypothetical protein